MVTRHDIGLLQRKAWDRVIQKDITVVQASKDNIDPDFIVLEIDEDDAKKHNIFYFLCIAPDGEIAQYDCNLPRYHRTFQDLLDSVPG